MRTIAKLMLLPCVVMLAVSWLDPVQRFFLQEDWRTTVPIAVACAGWFIATVVMLNVTHPKASDRRPSAQDLRPPDD
jgi:hypothetical protein